MSVQLSGFRDVLQAAPSFEGLSKPSLACCVLSGNDLRPSADFDEAHVADVFLTNWTFTDSLISWLGFRVKVERGLQGQILSRKSAASPRFRRRVWLTLLPHRDRSLRGSKHSWSTSRNTWGRFQTSTNSVTPFYLFFSLMVQLIFPSQTPGRSWQLIPRCVSQKQLQGWSQTRLGSDQSSSESQLRLGDSVESPLSNFTVSSYDRWRRAVGFLQKHNLKCLCISG